MDRIEKLIKEIKDDQSIWQDGQGRSTRFSGKFLNSVGDIFEQHGFGVTKVYLQNQSDRENKGQAIALLKVLKKMESYQEMKSNRAIGRYIMKSLQTLRRMEV